jgi:uncharacterized protein YegP (UPF0339 family)
LRASTAAGVTSARSNGLAARELVADEQILDDPADLLAVHEIKAGPPALEFEKARGAAVNIGEQVAVLAEPAFAGVEQFEIQHQMGGGYRARFRRVTTRAR